MSWEEIKERLIYSPPMKKEEAYGPVFKRIDYTGTVCEDCDKTLDEQRVVEIQKRTTPFAHWQRRCKNCGMHQDPRTLQYTLTSQQKATVLCTLSKKLDK